jgi:hypothetical protein
VTEVAGRAGPVSGFRFQVSFKPEAMTRVMSWRSGKGRGFTPLPVMFRSVAAQGVGVPPPGLSSLPLRDRPVARSLLRT